MKLTLAAVACGDRLSRWFMVIDLLPRPTGTPSRGGQLFRIN